jgi:hypothetical protein
MKVQVLSLLLILLWLSSCTDSYNSGYNEASKDSQITIDSLKIRCYNIQSRCDSIEDKYYEQTILIKLTELQCKKYAKIVKNNSNQSVFIVGWTDRAFSWVSKKK